MAEIIEIIEEKKVNMILGETRTEFPGPIVKTSDSEYMFPLSQLELVCFEPISITGEQLKNNVHKKNAINTAEEYNLPYVMLSKCCLTTSFPPFDVIGGQDNRSHTYLAQFYRRK